MTTIQVLLLVNLGMLLIVAFKWIFQPGYRARYSRTVQLIVSVFLLALGCIEVYFLATTALPYR